MTKDSDKKKKEFWFLWNALGVAFIIMAALHTIAPYLEVDDPNKPRVMDYATEIKIITSEDVATMLKSDNGKPTLLVAYASWCPTCRVKMPDIIDLMREGKLDHVNMLFISRDKGAMKLSKYLVRSGFYEDIKPYLVKDGLLAGDALKDVLKKKGSAYVGAIPFTELFSAEGKALTFIPHYVGKDALVAASKGKILVPRKH